MSADQLTQISIAILSNETTVAQCMEYSRANGVTFEAAVAAKAVALGAAITAAAS